MQAGFTIKDLELAFKVTKTCVKTLRITMGEKNYWSNLAVFSRAVISLSDLICICMLLIHSAQFLV